MQAGSQRVFLTGEMRDRALQAYRRNGKRPVRDESPGRAASLGGIFSDADQLHPGVDQTLKHLANHLRPLHPGLCGEGVHCGYQVRAE